MRCQFLLQVIIVPGPLSLGRDRRNTVRSLIEMLWLETNQEPQCTRETRSMVSSNSRFQTVLLQQYSANLSPKGPMGFLFDPSGISWGELLSHGSGNESLLRPPPPFIRTRCQQSNRKPCTPSDASPSHSRLASLPYLHAREASNKQQAGQFTLPSRGTSETRLRPVSLLRLSLLRFLDSNIPGKSLWT